MPVLYTNNLFSSIFTRIPLQAIRKKMFVVFGAFLVAWSLAGVYIGKNFLEKEDEEGQKYVKKPIDVLKGTIDTTRAWETLLGPRISKSELDVKKPYELDD